MSVPNNTKKFAVIGWPVAHSLSPQIHQHFAKQFDEDISYVKLPAKTNFAERVRAFFEQGGSGMNVTLPYKHEAFRLCEFLSDDAVKAGSVNTLWHQDGNFHGANTDGTGLINDLKHNLNRNIQGNKLLIIGAGGATYGIIWPLLQQQPDSICIVNRTLAKSEKLVKHFAAKAAVAGLATSIQPVALSDLAGSKVAYDLIIHSTSAGIDGELPALPDVLCAPGAFGYDLSYREAARPFLTWAENLGLEAADGLGMLVEQAALSFGIWLGGLEPETAAVIEYLRTQSQIKS